MDWSEKDKVWGRAIHNWLQNEPEALSELIKCETTIPDEGRHFLSDLVLNKVSKGKGGRRNIRSPQEERIIVAEVYSLRLSGLKKDEAICEVATSNKLSEETIRGIIQSCPITFLKWKEMHCPDFK